MRPVGVVSCQRSVAFMTELRSWEKRIRAARIAPVNWIARDIRLMSAPRSPRAP